MSQLLPVLSTPADGTSTPRTSTTDLPTAAATTHIAECSDSKHVSIACHEADPFSQRSSTPSSLNCFLNRRTTLTKLASCASSNASEALNNTFTSLAPKRLHFGGSESYDYCLGRGVASKTIGNQYVPQEMKEAGLSSGGHTQKFAGGADRIKARERARCGTVVYAQSKCM